jgi:hypothetical protein
MTTEVSVPEFLHWGNTRVTGKGPNQKNTGWTLQFSTPLPGSDPRYKTNIYPRDPAIMIYQDGPDGAQTLVQHTKVEPDGSTTDWESNIVEIGDVVAVELRRGTFKAAKMDGSPNNPEYASNYFWDLISIAPATGQSGSTGGGGVTGSVTGSVTAAAGTGGSGAVEGVIKGHCENIISRLAVAKLLPGIEREDGQIDWEAFRAYRDEYYHIVSNVPIGPALTVPAVEEDEDEEV